jgi:hypothetical protein
LLVFLLFLLQLFSLIYYMRNFKNLTVWQKSHELISLVYKATKVFPKDELYGLVSQMRRSASSIPTNITSTPTPLYPQNLNKNS